jgi:hypothetical protein
MERQCTPIAIGDSRRKPYICLQGQRKINSSLVTLALRVVSPGQWGSSMVTALKIEFVSICAAFAFITGVLAAVW